MKKRRKMPRDPSKLARQSFSTSEAADRIRPFVVLSSTPRESTGQVRSAISRDGRFVKNEDGTWRKVS